MIKLTFVTQFQKVFLKHLFSVLWEVECCMEKGQRWTMSYTRGICKPQSARHMLYVTHPHWRAIFWVKSLGGAYVPLLPPQGFSKMFLSTTFRILPWRSVKYDILHLIRFSMMFDNSPPRLGLSVLFNPPLLFEWGIHIEKTLSC